MRTEAKARWLIAETNLGGEALPGTTMDITGLVLDAARQDVASNTTEQSCAADDVAESFTAEKRIGHVAWFAA